MSTVSKASPDTQSYILPITFQNFDVYNPTVTFKYNGKTLILGRVESRDSEKDSRVMFFEQNEAGWGVIPDSPLHNLQDPFIFQIKDKWLLGGVSVNWETYSYQTDFYIGDDPLKMTKHFSGPRGMKDIRLLELSSGKIAVFTRPQGGIYKKGKIGFTLVNDLSELTTALIENAPLLDDQFGDDTWGGVNQAVELTNGHIGVIGHWAWFVGENRKYTGIAFELNPITRECTEMRIIATRDQFPTGPAKRPDLSDVIFPAGMVFDKEKNVASLYAGLSDAQIGVLQIPYPFKY